MDEIGYFFWQNLKMILLGSYLIIGIWLFIIFQGDFQDLLISAILAIFWPAVGLVLFFTTFLLCQISHPLIKKPQKNSAERSTLPQ